MDGHSHQCEMHYIYEKVREQEEEIDKLSSQSTCLLSKIKKQIINIDCNNPEKEKKYAKIYQENEKKIQNIKLYKQQLKKHTIQLQNRVQRSNTIKNFGLLGYLFAFMIKSIEKMSVGSTHEEIISFIIYIILGVTMIFVDWVTQGIDMLIFHKKSYFLYILFVLGVYFFTFGFLRLLWRKKTIDLCCTSPKRIKNPDNPGWILNP